MIFTMKMHNKWFSLWKCITNDFYYENALQMIFIITYDFLLSKCIACFCWGVWNGVPLKDLPKIFAIKIKKIYTIFALH